MEKEAVIIIINVVCNESGSKKENEEKSTTNNVRVHIAICVFSFLLLQWLLLLVLLLYGNVRQRQRRRHSFSDVTTNSLGCHFTNAYILFFWLLDIYVNWIISEPLNICVTAFFFCTYIYIRPMEYENDGDDGAAVEMGSNRSTTTSMLQWLYLVTKCIANATSC